MGTTGQVVLGVTGAVIGGLVGGPSGAAIGFSVGYQVGGIIDPPNVPGPSIGEAAVQTSRDGVPIPIGWGIFAVVGNLIQQNPMDRVDTDIDGGKKGAPSSSETRSYRTFAIRMGRGFDGPIESVDRSWENEKLVYDTRESPAIPIEETLAFAEGIRIYLGSEDTLPDPDLEAYTGVGFTPYYRGLPYTVFIRKDLTDFAEAIPTYRFEINAGDGYQASTWPYPAEGINAIDSGFTWVGDDTISPPINASDVGFSFLSADIETILTNYQPDPEGVDAGFTFIGAQVQTVILNYQPDPEGVDVGFAFISADVVNIRIDYAMEPEGVDAGFTFLSGVIT